MANAILIANFVKSVDPAIKQSLEDMGVKVRIVDAFDCRGPTSNKIRMLETDEYDYDVFVALDCDTAVVQDFSSEINSQFFQALPVDVDILTIQQWQKFLSYLNWEVPPERFDSKKRTIFPYFNGGVLSIPKQYVKRLRKTWGEYTLLLFKCCQDLWLDELTYPTHYFDEITLSLAVEKEKIPLKALTLEMNFSVESMNSHFRAITPEKEIQPDNMLPFILHYHHKYDTDGLIMKTGYKMPDLALQMVNELLLDERNHMTEQFDKKVGIVSQKVVLAKQKVIEQRERLIKAKNNQLRRAMRDVDMLQNINLNHQKTIEGKDAQLKRAINDVEILQNINITQQKSIEEKDRQIEQLDSRLKTSKIDVGS